MAAVQALGVDVQAEAGKTFWQTAPGMITAVAALITALGGLLGILVQTGVIGGGNDDSSSGTTPAVATENDGSGAGRDDQASADATTKPAADPTVVPWTSATATLTRNDGTTVDVKAPTVGLACNTEVLQFENGQTVDLELVRTIEFKAIYYENSSADGVVTL